MARRVIVIASPDSPFQAGGCAFDALAPGASCERIAWADLSLQQLAARVMDLVVAVAVPETNEVARVFHWLADHPLKAVTFAVLPRSCRSDLLSAAARAVDDFILWPASAEELRLRLLRIRRQDQEAEAGLAESLALGQMIGRAPVFVDLLTKLPRAANAGVAVLLEGETGTGKELCARALHFLSTRRPAPFVPVDCGALPDLLFESEVFGHVRGAFTDAHCEQRGLVALADGGTLFLDEVDALSAGAQAKLLRFLEEHRYRPLGSDRFARADVNVISASNQDLERLAQQGRFRPDLFFRLAGLRLRLPPLRERPGDIDLLALHFLDEHQRHCGSPPRVLSEAALRVLRGHTWPGNVRELAHVVRRALVFAAQRQILAEDIALPSTQSPPDGAHYRQLRASVVAEFERRYLEDLLRRHRGNLTRASREAGQDRRALARLAKKHAVDLQRFH